MSGFGARALVALALLAGDVSADRAAATPAYRSEAGRFEVWLPGAPRRTSERRLTLAGPVASAEYAVVREGLDLRVEHHDLPPLARAFLSDDALLRRAERELLADENGERLASLALAVGGHPARQVSFRIREAPQHGRALFVLVGGRVYVVAALWPASDSVAPVERFFASFAFWQP